MANSILRYLKPVDGLPDPRGSITRVLPTSTVALANKEVQNVLAPKKRGPYKKYSPAQRLEIGKYCCENGAASAARHFSRKLGCVINESTIKSIRNAYLEEVKKRPREDDSFTSLPAKKRGRKLLVGKDLDFKIQLYLQKVREAGGAISARIVMAAARAIVIKCEPSLLVENGGPFSATKHWAHSLLSRMRYVQRKATTSKSKYSHSDFAKARRQFLEDVYTTVTMEDIVPELLLNWDQTGI